MSVNVEEFYNGPDVTARGLFEKLLNDIEVYKKVDAELTASKGDKDALIKSWIANPTSKEGKQLRKTIDDAMAKLRELANTSVKVETLSPEDIKKKESEKDELIKSIRGARKLAESVAKTVKIDEAGVMNALEKIGDPTKTGRGRQPGSGGSKLPRVRAIVIINGGNLKDERCDTFTKAASTLNMPVEELQKAFANAAGVAHADISSVKKSVTFKIKPHEKGSEYTITTHPKQGATPGPKPKSEKPAASPAA